MKKKSIEKFKNALKDRQNKEKIEKLITGLTGFLETIGDDRDKIKSLLELSRFDRKELEPIINRLIDNLDKDKIKHSISHKELSESIKNALSKSNIQNQEIERLLDIIKENTEKEFPEIPKFPEKVEIKQPKWWIPFSDSKILNAVGTLSKNILHITKQLLRVDLSVHADPARAIAVKLVYKGKEYIARGGGGGGGPGTVVIDGKISFKSGRGVVTTAGTRVQLSSISVACKKIWIQNHEDNGDSDVYLNNGTIVVGDENVVAALNTRQGYAIYPTQAYMIEVDNLNKVWIDSVDDGVKFHFTYEN